MASGGMNRDRSHNSRAVHINIDLSGMCIGEVGAGPFHEGNGHRGHHRHASSLHRRYPRTYSIGSTDSSDDDVAGRALLRRQLTDDYPGRSGQQVPRLPPILRRPGFMGNASAPSGAVPMAIPLDTDANPPPPYSSTFRTAPTATAANTNPPVTNTTPMRVLSTVSNHAGPVSRHSSASSNAGKMGWLPSTPIAPRVASIGRASTTSIVPVSPRTRPAQPILPGNPTDVLSPAFRNPFSDPSSGATSRRSSLASTTSRPPLNLGRRTSNAGAVPLPTIPVPRSSTSSRHPAPRMHSLLRTINP